MAKLIKNYDVFISSPSDVSLERDTVQEALEEINQFNGNREGFRLNPIRWEKDVSSQLGASPQKIINEQVGNEYDIFIGILCNRFGQSTDAYESGTEEEFFRAYERHSSGEDGPEILFYFKDPRRSDSPIVASQLVKVSEFKETIGNLGIYGEFETQQNLKTMVMAALVKAVERLAKRSSCSDQQDTKKQEKISTVEEKNTTLEVVDVFDEDTGLIEITDIVYESLERLTETLGTIAKATENLGAKIENRTVEINGLSKSGDARQDNKTIKPIIEKVAAEMQRYSSILDQETPIAKKDFFAALRGMQHAIMISNQDGVDSENDAKLLVENLDEMKLTLTHVYSKLLSFQKAISSTPRMTSKLNQARRRTINSIQNFLDFLNESSSNIDITSNAIR